MPKKNSNKQWMLTTQSVHLCLYLVLAGTFGKSTTLEEVLCESIQALIKALRG